jgi:hypothetical protein
LEMGWWWREQRRAAGGELGRRRIAGMGRKRPSDLDFERGLHWEQEHDAANPFRGSILGTEAVEDSRGGERRR